MYCRNCKQDFSSYRKKFKFCPYCSDELLKGTFEKCFLCGRWNFPQDSKTPPPPTNEPDSLEPMLTVPFLVSPTDGTPVKVCSDCRAAIVPQKIKRPTFRQFNKRLYEYDRRFIKGTLRPQDGPPDPGVTVAVQWDDGRSAKGIQSLKSPTVSHSIPRFA